ncbi:hypothetical protein [Streptomyces sp. NPDC101132]|uniref:hypothetical protein n=1 Tax=Streptomyces sp. NPDC101132 TaxID=3366110 RepID=UPI0037FB003E
MRQDFNFFERGSAYQAQPDTPGPGPEEPAPAPVFVDQSGTRGRLLRGFGWPVSLIGAVLAVAMGSSLVGVQADAPAMGVPEQPTWAPAPATPLPSPARTRPSAPSASPSRSASSHPSASS